MRLAYETDAIGYVAVPTAPILLKANEVADKVLSFDPGFMVGLFLVTKLSFIDPTAPGLYSTRFAY